MTSETPEHIPELAASAGEQLQSELYHENSKQRRHDLEFARRIYAINNNEGFHRVIARTFKRYPGARQTLLPAVVPRDGPGFEAVAARRRSVRRFDGSPLSLADLGRLLWLGAGLTGRLQPAGDAVSQPVRAAPSAGALYPVELYAVALTVEGLNPGVFHYEVDRHAVESLRSGDLRAALADATSDAATFAGCSVAFVLSAVFGRSRFKYGERAYRFALLEAGHMCQNLLLAAEALGLGAVAVGGFVDDEINALLDLDGVDEAALCIAVVGRPASDERSLVDRLLEDLWRGPPNQPS